MTHRYEAIEIARRVRTQEQSAEAVIQSTLSRIRKWNTTLGAYLAVSDTALDDARAVDSRVRAGEPVGPLCGVPVAIKDLIDTQDLRTTYGGRHRFPERNQVDAAVVTRLREAGAIIMGKTNLHEYAFGTTGVNPHFGPARNPWDRDRISGGSSSGSSVALVAGLCAAAIGTDTGGSIRIPASLTGHVGLKPTYGLVDTTGTFPLAASLDHVGPMTRSIADARLMLHVMTGTSQTGAHEAGICSRQLDPANDTKPLRIGIPENFFYEIGEPSVLQVLDDSMEIMEKCGLNTKSWTLHPVQIPMMDVVPRAQSILLFSEALAVHYSKVETEAERYGVDVLNRLIAAKEYRAYEYIWAQSIQSQFQQALRNTWNEVDLIVTPSVPIEPPNLDQLSLTLGNETLPVPSLLNRCTNPWNLSHLPALSMPCGWTADGLPVGLQVIAPWFAESLLLSFAETLEGIFPASPRLPEYE